MPSQNPQSPRSNSNGNVPDNGPVVDLAYPFTGRWLVQNSPANRVPSHGTEAFATSYAIDFVPVDESGRTTRVTWRGLLRPESADHFPGFGRSVLSPVDAVVHSVHDGEPDHPAHRGLPSLGYALTQSRRAAAGWRSLSGNSIFLLPYSAGADTPAPVIALCHLQRGSITVRAGQRVTVGEPLGACGNSGNSTEPHLHVQAMDSPDAARAQAVPLSFDGGLPGNGEIVDLPER